MNNRHVLITGGNRGIGLEVSNLLLKKGYTITIVARDISNVQNIPNCNAIAFDLRNTSEISKLISSIPEVDILINNAGIMTTCTYLDYPTAQKEDILKINIEAPVELITCVSHSMKRKKQGRIVNNASIAGHIGHPDIWYGISKAGLINATKSFAKQLGPHGIVVNSVAAGPVQTEMLNTIPHDRQETLLRNGYLGRFAQPKEVAETIVWLATESPVYINGACIDVNDGAYIR